MYYDAKKRKYMLEDVLLRKNYINIFFSIIIQYSSCKLSYILPLN